MIKRKEVRTTLALFDANDCNYNGVCRKVIKPTSIPNLDDLIFADVLIRSDSSTVFSSASSKQAN